MASSPSNLNGPSRRTVLRGAASAASGLFLAPFVRASRSSSLPWARQEGGAPLSSKLKLAAIGAGNRAAANIAGVLSEDVAVLCDVDEILLARGIAQIQKAGQPRPKTYRDWRELLSKETDLDGIVISTPDHTHAAIARAALSLSRPLPVYCEKPLTRTVEESGELQQLAKSAEVATQMGTQIHATDNYRRVVEALQSGAIGRVLNAHVVCSKSWSKGAFHASEGEAPRPAKGFDWDLWLGPTPDRPYSPGVHPANWRRFWAFGNGTVGDMAAHWIDLVHWALRLGPPKSVEAEGPPVDEVGTPEWMKVRWTHGAHDENGVEVGTVDVHWYDGSATYEGAPLPDCHVFEGTKGRIISTYGSMKVELASGEDGTREFVAPEKSIPSSPGHYVEWLQRIKDPKLPEPLCHFGYAGPLTDSILLAGVAYRAGGRIPWNPETRDAGPGNKFLAAEERDGWRL
ncbi:MAG: Gfo/Idh/MocA family oxidoreductase [Planctomycetota bacterium]